MVVGVVLVALGRTDAEAVAAAVDSDAGQTVVEALAEGGWVEGPTPTTGLPKPDLVFAVREELV